MKTRIANWACAWRGVCVTAGLVGLGLASAQGAGQATSFSTNTYGSGRLYQTTVERQHQGEASPEDVRQASALTSQLLTHVNKAAQWLEADYSDGAKAEIQKAQSLLKVVRGLVPRTIVRTRIKDADGKEVYYDEQRLEGGWVPIFAEDIAVEVTQPIGESTGTDGGLERAKVAGANSVDTVVVVDLDLVEQKLNEAAANGLMLEKGETNMFREIRFCDDYDGGSVAVVDCRHGRGGRGRGREP